MALREYVGTAKPTTLAGGISAAATSITLADGSGYPTGATAPFVITIDSGNAAEEKVLCASRAGNTITVSSRGWDGTTASDHDNAASVAHTFSATDAREANQLASGGGTITAPTAGAVVLTVKGAPSATASLFSAVDSAGTVLLSVAASGRLNASRGANITGAAGDHGALITTTSASNHPLVVRGAPSHTANLAQFETSAGALLLAVLSDGRLQLPSANSVILSGTLTGAIGSFANSIQITIDGTNYKIPVYN